jgi:hypothetical protein
MVKPRSCTTHPALPRVRGSRAPSSRILLLVLACCMAGLGASACSTTRTLKPIEVETGPGAEVTADGLHRARGSAFRHLWIKPDADLQSYDALILDPIQVSYRRKPTSRRYSSGSANFALSDSQMALLKQEMSDAFAQAIVASPNYQLVEVPGPDVMRVEASIIDLIVKTPTDTRGNENVYITSAGEMTLLLELRDSESGEALARLTDEKQARAPGHGGVNDLYWSNAATNTVTVRRIFKRWAQILVARLDEVHAIEAPATPVE